MTAQPTEPGTTLPRKSLAPIDPDSEHGRRVTAALSDLLGEITDELHRDGEPLPDCISP